MHEIIGGVIFVMIISWYVRSVAKDVARKELQDDERELARLKRKLGHD